MALSYDLPFQQSKLALKLKDIADQEVFLLPVCQNCHAVQYPLRERCGTCLSENVEWQAVDCGGKMMASTSVHVSFESHFNKKTPYHIGLVRLDAGATLLVYLPNKVAPGKTVTVKAEVDDFGTGILVARECGSSEMANN